jgi:two-component system chemotaxis sensor kinase CheA
MRKRAIEGVGIVLAEGWLCASRRMPMERSGMNDDDIVKEFLVESHENLDQLDQLLVELEENPTSRERLASIFRTIHTLKGTSGFLAFHKLEAIAHVGENLLSKLRDGELALDQARTNALLSMVDSIRQLLRAIEATGREDESDPSQLVALLTALTEPGPAPTATKSIAPKRPTTAPVAKRESVAPIRRSVAPLPLAPANELPAEPRTAVGAVAPRVDENEEHGETKRGATDSSIRVDVQLLDRLMNLVGELVLARNQVLQVTTNLEDAVFQATSQRLNLVTTELQEGIMKTRMQPIGSIWNKYPRVVRDLSAQCGKQIRLELEGADTELDRSILEAIKDPLTHVVRNSADHGIERPEARTARGKPAQGTLRLRAFHEGGKVNIEVSDDGGGIDVERVREKAIVRGLITQERAAAMSERELTQLIFLPGFSTADKVSNVSGRGVGMDVVRTNVERIGGTIDLASRRGQGTTLRIRIPLTLAIVPALVVAAAGDRYAIPQVNLLELVRLEGEQAKSALDDLHGTKVLRLRGQLLPLVRLRDVLGLPEHHDDHVNVVVLQADDRAFGVVVDDISDTEEIVVKPLGKELKGLGVYAGATIMGDGHIALILDVLGIAERAGLVDESRGKSALEATGAEAVRASSTQRLLVFRAPAGDRSAIPLDAVARLEELRSDSIERSGRDEVVQYRGELLPIIRLPGHGGGDPELLHVVVCAHRGRLVGIVVGQIEDIVEQELDLYGSTRAGTRTGCAVIQGKVTSILDVPAIVQNADLGLARASAANEPTPSLRAHTAHAA